MLSLTAYVSEPRVNSIFPEGDNHGVRDDLQEALREVTTHGSIF